MFTNEIVLNMQELRNHLLVVGFYKIHSELECLSFTLLDMNAVQVTLNMQYTYITLPATDKDLDEAVWSAIWAVCEGKVARTISEDKNLMRIYPI